MFTGLIETIGTISVLRPKEGGRELAVSCPDLARNGLKPGDSVAVNGACLTVEKVDADRFWARVMPQTVKTTTLKEARVGQRVNLERALQVGGRLGGHFVLGHVDAAAAITKVDKQGEAWLVEVEFPADLGKYIVPKGSICLDGVSLTVAELEQNRLAVSLVKETLGRTTLREAAPGRKLNLEVDILAKHVAMLLNSWGAAKSSSPSPALQEFISSLNTKAGSER